MKISPIEGECLVDGFSATLLHPKYTLSRFLVEAFEIVSRNLIDLYKRLPVRTLINPIRNPDRTLTESPQKHFVGRCMDPESNSLLLSVQTLDYAPCYRITRLKPLKLYTLTVSVAVATTSVSVRACLCSIAATQNRHQIMQQRIVK